MTEITLYNTRARARQVFRPIDAGNVRMYVCGPTVYDRAHLGNARPVVVFDMLYRLLRYVYGPGNVTYVRNFTDVDDKIIARAAETGRAIGAITEETTRWFLEDMGALGALRPDQMPRATDYIGPMVAMISDLIDKGHAYAAAGHVLFAVESYKDYGRLSGRSVDDMIAGARVEVAPYKRDPMDFVLWKPSDADQPGWDSPWGRGRPGWHIECSAMSHALLGPHFDIHGGGNDLIFPHHENEIAQSCCAHPAPEGEECFASYWLHNEMLQVEGRKMSKSLGNFFTVRDLLEKGVPGEVIRFVMLQTHYRKPMDWTERKRRNAQQQLELWALEVKSSWNVIEEFEDDPVKFAQRFAPTDLVAALADDLNTSLALTILGRIWRNTLQGPNRAKHSGVQIENAHRELIAGCYLLGIDILRMGRREKADLSPFEALFTELRAKAMETKDFSELDAFKETLITAGVEVRMSREGVELVAGPDFDPAKLEGLT